MPDFYFRKPIPFVPKAGTSRPESSRLTRSTPTEPVFYSSLLAGVAFGMLVFTGFSLTLLMASLVWTSPHRDWFLSGLVLAYLSCTFATTQALGRRLRAWLPLKDIQMRLRQGGRDLGNLLESVHQGRMPSASDH